VAEAFDSVRFIMTRQMRILAALLIAGWSLCHAAGPDSCITCHAAMDDGPKAPATLIKNDVHIAHGLSCADCHGGDRTTDDPEASMSRAKGFKGAPARRDIPKFCASCHSNPDYMRHYAPRERVDQFELYQTSVHGKRLSAARAGNLLPLPFGQSQNGGLQDPTNQFVEYQGSVHGQALLKRGDVSAPNCASCHGNHGAKPPQVEWNYRRIGLAVSVLLIAIAILAIRALIRRMEANGAEVEHPVG
jgi:hypothetical protein